MKALSLTSADCQDRAVSLRKMVRDVFKLLCPDDAHSGGGSAFDSAVESFHFIHFVSISSVPDHRQSTETWLRVEAEFAVSSTRAPTIMATKMELNDVPRDTVVYISSKVEINAPASQVFGIVMKTSTWSEWNSFVPEVKTAKPEEPLEVGTRMELMVKMTPDSAPRGQKIIVTQVTQDDSLHRVCWTVEGFPSFMLRTNRTTEVEDRGSSCEYRSWEVMAGPAAYTVKALYNKSLQDRFEDMANDLKAYVEGLSAAN